STFKAVAQLPPLRQRSYVARSRMYLSLTMYQDFVNEDALSSAEQAAADARQASVLDPNSSDTQNLLGVALSLVVHQKRWKNRPVERDQEELLKAATQAAELRRDIPLTSSNLGSLHLENARARIDHGLDPSPEFEAAEKPLKEVLAKHPDFMLAVVTEL